MKNKKLLKRMTCIVLCFLMLFGMLPVTEVEAAIPSRIKAYDAYYTYLQEEVDNLGGVIRDTDYYNMFTDKIQRNAKVQKLLAVYFTDVTNDGLEELIIKRYVEHKSTAMLDFSDHEWVCIYSYVNGQIKRIGQNSSWVRPTGNGSWSYYEPAGYIGDILSSWEYPHISDDCVYVCKGTNGKVYLADIDPSSVYDETVHFYAYNGSVMSEVAEFRHRFVNDYIAGVQMPWGDIHYYVNGTEVSSTTFNSQLKSYYSKGNCKLVNNQYTTVLNQLKNAVKAYYTPSDWAVSEVNAAISNGYVPKNLQKFYTEPITRAEFCALATNMYESMTGMEIEERKTFKDTSDVNVQKMGALGIVNGVGGGNFGPNNLLTRQEAATMLARLADKLLFLLNDGSLTFADNAKIDSWAKDAVARISASGVMNGVGNNTFSPLGSYTREQAMLTILRLSYRPVGEPVLVTGVTLNKANMNLLVGGTGTLVANVLPADATNKKVEWKTSDSRVATVSNEGVVTAVDEGTAVITVEASGYTASCTVNVGPVPATGIKMNRSEAVTNVGRTVELTVTLTPANASTKHISWSSSDPGVATVSNSGIVTGQSEGTAVITAETFGKKATCKITVSSAPLGLENFQKKQNYNNQFQDVASGDWFRENVKTAYEYGLMNGASSTKFNPYGNLSIAEAITIASRIHNTYHDNGATFKASGQWYQGYVDYAVKHGIIKNGAFSNYDAAATRMQFAGILANSVPKEALGAINNVGNGIPDVPPEMNGASAVYLLYNAGILSGSSAYGNFNPDSTIVRSEACAIITRIAVPSLRKTFTLRPVDIPVQGISFDREYVGMVAGESKVLTIKPVPSNATIKSPKWSSSNTSVATVSSDGTVTAVGAGQATVTVKVGSYSASATISVVGKPMEYSGSGYETINVDMLTKGPYYLEYSKTAGNKFTAETIWNYGYDADVVSDYVNASGRAFIAKALDKDTSMSLSIDASGPWSIKICPVNESGSTNLQGHGNWVGGMFKATQRKYTARLSHDEGKNLRVHFYRVDKSERSTIWEHNVENGMAEVILTEGAYYVPVIETYGNWSVDLGIGDPLEIVN